MFQTVRRVLDQYNIYQRLALPRRRYPSPPLTVDGELGEIS
ncbi:hypothetical protein [Microseira wollei]|nr:hypothetical protein [Microseira wollei]